MPRPLLSGMPPRRLYVDPDEQIEFIKQQDEQRKKEKETVAEAKAGEEAKVLDDGKNSKPDGKAEPGLPPVREWVLPTHIRESTSLRKLSSVFDNICSIPPVPDSPDGSVLARSPPEEHQIEIPDKWRETKRLLLAAVDDDSTIVYYIVHDGVVKPRQN